MGSYFKVFEVGFKGQFIFISKIKCHQNFAPLALESTSAMRLAKPVNPTMKYTTINTYAGVALDPNSWDRRLDG